MPMANTFLCECDTHTSYNKHICKCGKPVNYYGFSVILRKICTCQNIKSGRYCYICGESKKDYCCIDIF